MRVRLAACHVCVFGCIWVGIALTAGAVGFFAWQEAIIILHPQECFEILPECEVLRVEHRFNVTGPNCLDVFTYEFELPGLPVVFAQEEELLRKTPGCLLASITVENATYKPGINRCFRVKKLFESDSESFNCADVLRPNNATGSACQSLLPPVSKRILGIFYTYMVLEAMVMSLWCCSLFDCLMRLRTSQMEQRMYSVNP